MERLNASSPHLADIIARRLRLFDFILVVVMASVRFSNHRHCRPVHSTVSFTSPKESLHHGLVLRVDRRMTHRWYDLHSSSDDSSQDG
jgi:hypothetical protein